MAGFWSPRRVAAGAVLLVVLALAVVLVRHRGVQAAASGLTFTFDSPERLAEAALERYARGDLDGLRRMALTEEEFRQVVWPELPASRPERNTPIDFVWGMLRQKSESSLRRLMSAHAGRRYQLLGLEFREGATPYDGFVVHREAVLRLRDEDGHERELALFGSVLQRGRGYKLFSFVAD
jgi:hypothetical protein